MCGIAGFYLVNPEFRVDYESILDDLLLGIEHRGKDATGFTAVSMSGAVEWHKAACDATTFIRHRRALPDGVRGVIAHTRFATQGLPAFIENNHPLKRGTFHIVHNGHVFNDAEMFKLAERTRFGDVDSEAIAALLSEKGDLSALGEVMTEIDGDAAVAALDERNPSRIVLAKGCSSPLHIYATQQIMLFASTRDTIEGAHKLNIGRPGKRNFLAVTQGEQFEWVDGKRSMTRFKVTERPFKFKSSYVYKPWDGENYSYSTPGPKAQEVEVWKGWDDDPFDYNCDNCDEGLTFQTTYYRHVPGATTFLLCRDCSTLWDEGALIDLKGDDSLLELHGEQEIIDAELADECQVPWMESSDRRSPIIDDFHGANRSILRRLFD